MSRELCVIGLTGNIATGKSAVCDMLACLGARVIDADALTHEVMRKGTEVWQRVRTEFGAGILRRNGEINRARLGALVFADSQALARLEAIVHPAVIAECERMLQDLRDASRAARATGIQIVVLEAIKLIESGMTRRCDELWVVTSPREQQVQRLIGRRGLSETDAERRIDAQPPQADKVTLADVVIDNGGSLEQTRAQVEREWQRIQSAHAPERAAP